MTMTIAELRRLFSYDDWANRKTLASLRTAVGEPAGAPPERARRWMGHIVATERLWLGRIRADGEEVVVWPDLTLDECDERADAMARLWTELFDGLAGGLADGDLSRPVGYVNSLGEAWTSTVGDILLHTVMHSVHHRGQIAAELRRHGHTPAYSDFIHATRRGLVE
jgi:uncharacterized damage-inducible protein DinB